MSFRQSVEAAQKQTSMSKHWQDEKNAQPILHYSKLLLDFAQEIL
jgi:hypothetical protein